jgi:hypothetical protein
VGEFLITIALIIHGLFATALIGAVTHQAMAQALPARKKGGFVTRMRAVNPAAYTNAIIILFLITFALGAFVYPAYRVSVRTWLEAARLMKMSGSFEAKEQIVTIALGLLPYYWYIWRGHNLTPALERARTITTLTLGTIVWLSFLVGHVLNNVKGLFGL